MEIPVSGWFYLIADAASLRRWLDTLPEILRTRSVALAALTAQLAQNQSAGSNPVQLSSTARPQYRQQRDLSNAVIGGFSQDLVDQSFPYSLTPLTGIDG